MAEENNGGTSPKKPKQLSMELRLLLAFILMGVVLFTTPYFYKMLGIQTPKKDAGPPPAAASPQTGGAGQNAAAQSPTPPPPGTGVPPAAAAVPAVAGEKQKSLVISTDLYRITFSNK